MATHSNQNDDKETNVKAIPLVIVEKVLQTEDTGKIFEMAICLAYDIPYDGKFKYSMELPNKLKLQLSKLLEIFPMCKHTAKKGQDMIIRHLLMKANISLQKLQKKV